MSLLALCGADSIAQSGLAGWTELPPGEFIVMANAWKAAGGTDAETQAALGAHAASLLTTTNVIRTGGDYGILSELYRWGRSDLTPEQAVSIAHQLVDRPAPTTTLPYMQLHYKVLLMDLANVSFKDRAAEVAAWLEADQTGCEGVWKDAFIWLYNMLSYPHISEGSFAVAWTGKLTAPRTGDYVFSISPINVNDEVRFYYCRNTWSIRVGGHQALQATATAWTTSSAPIRLTGGESVDLAVEVRFDNSQHAIDALHAMLSWQGPGLSPEIIPTAALRTPDGTRNGLLGQYSVVVADRPQVIARIDPTIDFAWTTGHRIVPEHREALAKLVEAMWNACMDPAY